jgi:hypothetical protein
MTELKVVLINTGVLKSVEQRQLLFIYCRDGYFYIVGLQELAFHACPIIESSYLLFTNLGPNKNGSTILLRHGLNHSRPLLDPDWRLISIDLESFTFVNVYMLRRVNEQRRNETIFWDVPSLLKLFPLCWLVTSTVWTAKKDPKTNPTPIHPKL